MAKRPSISAELRGAIEAAPITRYELAKRSGVDAAVLCRFVAGERGMSLESIDAVAAVLDLHITGGGKHRKPAGTRRKGK